MEKIQLNNLREKNCQNPFQDIKKGGKVAWTTKPVGGGEAELSGPTTKKHVCIP